MANIEMNVLKVGDSEFEIADAQARQDCSELKDDLYNTLVTDTASGSIASFSDGADNVPVKSLTVAIEPVQSGSGDPSPDNIRPISGHTQAVVTRTGVNLWDEEWKVVGSHIASKNPIPCLPDTTYYMSSPAGPSNGMKFWTKDMVRTGSTWYNAGQFTTPADCYYMTFEITDSYGTTYNHDISINYPSTDTDYHSGADNETYTIDLDGTRYGGTLNVETGVLTVDRAIVEYDGTNVAVTTVSQSSVTGNWYTRMSLPSTSKNTDDGKLGQAISNALTEGLTPTAQGKFSIISSGTDVVMVLTDQSITTVSAFNAYLAEHPIQLCYPLATPQTIQLTAQEVRTLLGQNNVFADCGDVSVEYRADTKLYIEKLTAPTEDDMIADHAISANSFFMVGNTLYRATTAIASGATITVGTNATKLSLSDALNALA